jgi:hypothetical protein
MTALASAGTLTWSSNQKVILEPVGDLSDCNPEYAYFVAGEDAVAVGEVPDYVDLADLGG